MNFPDKSYSFENLNESTKALQEEKLIGWADSSLSEDQRNQLQKLIHDFVPFFLDTRDLHSINTWDNPPVKTKYYWYEKVKTKIIEIHIAQLLKGGIIERCDSPYSPPVVLCR